MALYLGSNKVKLLLNGIVYNINLNYSANTSNSIRLLSSDGFTLQDINETYLIAQNNILLTLDDCLLQDSNSQYLTI